MLKWMHQKMKSTDPEWEWECDMMENATRSENPDVVLVDWLYVNGTRESIILGAERGDAFALEGN